MTGRRAVRRYRLALPVIVRRIPTLSESDLLYGKTRDISTEGLYFTTDQQVAPGTKLECSLTLPPEITGGAQVFVAAQVKVVRVQKKRRNGLERVGVAAAIEKYEIIRVQPKTS